MQPLLDTSGADMKCHTVCCLQETQLKYDSIEMLRIRRSRLYNHPTSLMSKLVNEHQIKLT